MQTNKQDTKSEYVAPRIETLGEFGIATQTPTRKGYPQHWDGSWYTNLS